MSLYGGGVDWVAKAMSCLDLIPNGGTLLIDDSLQGNAQTVGTFPSGVVLRFTGCGNFGFTTLNVGAFTKIFGHVTLTMLQPNAVGINQQTFEPLQTTDQLIIDGICLNGAGLVNVQGLSIGQGTAKVRVSDFTATGFTDPASCAMLTTAQFGSYENIHLYLNYVGWKIYGGSVIPGGSNSIQCSDLRTIDCTVGVLVNNAYGIKLENFNPLSCSAAGLAVFNGSQVYCRLGSPEHNGTNGNGPAVTVPITIDSNTIPIQSSIYVSGNSRVYLNEVSIQDATSSPEISVNLNSTAILTNLNGYGAPGGQLVNCDATSGVSLQGRLDSTGIVNGVLSYPTDMGIGQVMKLLGAPTVNRSISVPNAYTGNPVTIAFTDTNNSASSGTAKDPLYGTVSTVTHNPTPGSQDNNRWRIALPLSANPTNVDTYISLLVQASVACQYCIGWYGNNTTQSQVMNLPADVWQRFVMVVGAVANQNNGIVGFPRDSSGATISVAFLETLGYPEGSIQMLQTMSQVLRDGLINTNGN